MSLWLVYFPAKDMADPWGLTSPGAPLSPQIHPHSSHSSSTLLMGKEHGGHPYIEREVAT